MSVLPPRRPSTIRRRKKTVAAATDRLISDFNEGKEVDLDKLTARVTVGTAGVDGRVGPIESDVTSANVHVQNWVQTQNSVACSSQWAGPASKYHSLDVHHL